MTPLTLDECLLLMSADEYCPLWEAAWMFVTDKRERGERAIRTLVDNGLVSFSRTKSWAEQIETPLTADEQQQVLDNLGTHEDWTPGYDTSKSFISFFITAMGTEFLNHDKELRETLRVHRKITAAREGSDRYRTD